MTLQNYLTALRRGWALLLAAVLVGAAAGLGVGLLVPKTYASKVSWFVSFPTIGNLATRGAMARELMPTYLRIAESDVAANAAIQRMGSTEITKQQLAASVLASSPPESAVLVLTVRNSSPELARRLAQGYAVTTPDIVRILEDSKTSGNVKLNVLSGPTDPEVVDMNLREFVVVGAVLAFLAMLGWIALRSLRAPRVHSAQDARLATGAPLLGAVAAGSDPMASDPSGPQAEAYRFVRVNLQYLNPPAPALAFLGPEAGRHAALTALGTAMAFAEVGERVLLVDADLRAPQLAGLLEIVPGKGLAEVVRESAHLQDAVVRARGLDFLGSVAMPPEEAAALSGSAALSSWIARAASDYDRLVFVGSALDGTVDAVGLGRACDGVVMVVPQAAAGQTVRRAAQALRGVGARVVGAVAVEAAPRRAQVPARR